MRQITIGIGLLFSFGCGDKNEAIESVEECALIEDMVGDDIDQNCDGIDGVDTDQDGLASLESGGEDCDDQNPLSEASLPQWFYPDVDGDGFGDIEGILGCDAPENTVENDQDCNDNDASVHPNAPEICDDLDNDCDALVDSEDASLVDAIIGYQDTDSDGLGNPALSEFFCELPEGWVLEGLDCDDSDPESTSMEHDQDCDGFLMEWDCDDLDPVNACQSPAVETLAGRWLCPEDGNPNLPNFEHIGGNFFHLVFDWHDGGWCRKLGLIEITSSTSATDFEWVLHHEAPAEEEDFHWHTYSNTSAAGEFYWTHDLTTLSTWNTSFPESFTVSCQRCGPFDEESSCDTLTPPYPIDYDYPVPEEYICEPVNFTNIGG